MVQFQGMLLCTCNIIVVSEVKGLAVPPSKLLPCQQPTHASDRPPLPLFANYRSDVEFEQSRSPSSFPALSLWGSGRIHHRISSNRKSRLLNFLSSFGSSCCQVESYARSDPVRAKDLKDDDEISICTHLRLDCSWTI